MLYWLLTSGRLDPSTVAVIIDLPTPTLVHELRATLEHTGYYINFTHNYAMINIPLEKLLNKEAHFLSIEDC